MIWLGILIIGAALIAAVIIGCAAVAVWTAETVKETTKKREGEDR